MSQALDAVMRQAALLAQGLEPWLGDGTHFWQGGHRFLAKLVTLPHKLASVVAKRR